MVAAPRLAELSGSSPGSAVCSGGATGTEVRAVLCMQTCEHEALPVGVSSYVVSVTL